MNNLEQIIMTLIVVLGCILLGLIIALVIIKMKNKMSEKKDKGNNQIYNDEKNKTQKVLGKQSIFNFLEFDKIEDNMIVQDNGKKFLMAIQCQGINYDLMSEMEKVSVEEGFIQFLNTLRYKVQIYIQTRKVNLGSSIENYEKSVGEIELQLNKAELKYQEMLNSRSYTKKQLEEELFEVTKIKNLYNYGRDVIQNTKNMSLNKNILTKQYYIIIPYYTSELEENDFDNEETKNIAFSELYTRAQSIIRTLSACEIKGHILSSKELIDLLYVAYNRDDSEVYGIDKYLSTQADSIYSTAPDVLDRKMAILDEEIQRKALDEAQNRAIEAQSEKEKEIREKEKNKDDYIDDLAIYILQENEKTIGKDVVEEATKKIMKSKEKRKNKGRREKINVEEKK
jgi:hypothetical protein